MLSTFLIVFTFMAIVTGIMAIGVMFGRKPIAGSCGGMSAIGMESECDVCGGDKSKCHNESDMSKSKESQSLAYDAAE